MRNHASFATGAACNCLDHVAFLPALAEAEVAQWEESRIRWPIKAARFPVLKGLGSLR